MGEKLTYWGAVVFSALALILVVTNITLSNGNRTLQADVGARQSTISAGQAYSQLNQSLVQALADSSVKNNDSQLRALLTSQGITIKQPPAAAAKPADKPEKK